MTALTDAQALALRLAAAEHWRLDVEAAGARATLRQGRPDARLVLVLSPAAWAAEDRAMRLERLTYSEAD